MSPAIVLSTTENKADVQSESQYQKGVKQLCDKGIKTLPNKYVLPVSDRPDTRRSGESYTKERNLKLPVIDFAELQGPNSSQVLRSLANASERYGFFQLVNHGVSSEVIAGMNDVCKRFFELSLEERVRYMSPDVSAPVRYGTSYNQSKDRVFCWRDFLKLVCQPLTDVLPHWPSSPSDLRNMAVAYSKETRHLFLMLMEAILESLGLRDPATRMAEDQEDDSILKEFTDGSQIMIANFYPPCPEPDLTLGMPPHSDYGFLTLLLQDEVEGLQIQYEGEWVTVEPIPNAFVVNIGDHLEIFSNGRYKSVLHRVLVNREKPRVTVASLHSLPFNSMIQPSPKLIDSMNPRRYMDTDFATFLEFISTCEPKNKNFLESRKLT
ncbi:hypothetical protein Nepgr_032021 [Nepenthes gracilis]|uniref:Fe2OG dioxygenase domain-containing protein n=1 Tax=Nepenthes gracilis TaxID=150966 RepID=A0AAD3Y5R0_NEPGR|nr:hypothetical protein Nepgr_032021 [Nepenthes gracilis]